MVKAGQSLVLVTAFKASILLVSQCTKQQASYKNTITVSWLNEIVLKIGKIWTKKPKTTNVIWCGKLVQSTIRRLLAKRRLDVTSFFTALKEISLNNWQSCRVFNFA